MIPHHGHHHVRFGRCVHQDHFCSGVLAELFHLCQQRRDVLPTLALAERLFADHQAQQLLRGERVALGIGPWRDRQRHPRQNVQPGNVAVAADGCKRVDKHFVDRVDQWRLLEVLAQAVREAQTTRFGTRIRGSKVVAFVQHAHDHLGRKLQPVLAKGDHVVDRCVSGHPEIVDRDIG